MSCGGGPAPAVSVLLPVRDGLRFVATALRSLTAQTFRDFEVVVVDDGSSDGTCDLLRAYAATDRRVVVVRQPPRGIVVALEEGRRRARGALLARMDADDIAHPLRLERQVDLLRRDPSLVVVGCGVRMVPADGLTEGRAGYERWLNSLVDSGDLHRDLFVECPLAHPTLLLRSDAVEEVGGYRDAGVPEDYDLLLRLWEAGGRLGTVPEPLLDWTDRPDRLSRTGDAYTPEAFRRVKVEVLARTVLADRPGVVIWGAGPTGKAFSHTLAEAGIPVLAFVDLDPRKLGQTIHDAPVVPPDRMGDFPGAVLLGAVSGPRPREEIRQVAAASGLVEGLDFVAVA